MGLLDVLQGASNAAASNVSGPVDLLSWALRKAGVPVPANPVMGEQWMREKGLLATPQNKYAGAAGETLGLLSPIGAAAKAPQIAKGLLAAEDAGKRGAYAVAEKGNDMAQAYMARSGMMPGVTPRGAQSMQAPDWAEDFASVGGKLNPDGTVTVFHRTSPESAAAIKRTGTMRGKEDGLFFSSAADGQITQYGPDVVELRIPASRLMLDDLFDSEAHFRLPTRRSMEPVRVADWLKK